MDPMPQMGCTYCAVEDVERPAVGVCAECGGAVCATHGEVAMVPTYIKSSGGIGGPYVRAKRDRRRFLCRDCAADAQADGVAVYVDSVDA